MNWRDHLKIHPAAEFFPLMSEYDPAALKELAENIRVNGLIEPIVGWASGGQFLLDGRNRLDAMALLGLLYETADHHVGCKKWDGKQWTDRPGGRIDSGWESPGFRNLDSGDGDPYDLALSLNVHRRHLNAEGRPAGSSSSSAAAIAAVHDAVSSRRNDSGIERSSGIAALAPLGLASASVRSVFAIR
jgi:hypothetical protein